MSYSGVIPSQDVFLNINTPLSVVSGGGSSPSTIAGVQSTIANTGGYVSLDDRGDVSISSIGSVQISTNTNFRTTAQVVEIFANTGVMNLASLGNMTISAGAGDVVVAGGNSQVTLSGIGGPMTIAAPAGVNITSTLNVPQITGVSTINGVNTDDLPYATQNLFMPQDKVISSINVSSFIGSYQNGYARISTFGAPITPFLSTIEGDRYLSFGNFVIKQVSTFGMPSGATAPNAFLAVIGGGGNGNVFPLTNNIYTYPQVSTQFALNSATAAGGFGVFSYVAGSAGTNSQDYPAPGTSPPSTINYSLLCSPDWPVPIQNVTSTFFTTVSGTDYIALTDLNCGKINFTP